MNCQFGVESIETLPFDRRFDAVVAADVLEHIADDGAAVERLSRFLRPDGRLVLTVPAGGWLFGYHDEALGHFRRYSRIGLQRLVADHARVESVRCFGATLIPVCLLYSPLLRRAYPVRAAGDQAGHPLMARVVRLLLGLERRLSLPFGTSLVLSATREAE